MTRDDRRSAPNIYKTRIFPKYKSYTLRNFRNIPQMQTNFSEAELFEMEVVGNVLPFKTNNYVVDELINWDRADGDPIFRLVFPQKNMLRPEHYDLMATTLKRTNSKSEIRAVANIIREELNPNPSGQKDLNVPIFNGKSLSGVQHKYRQTVLFFPSQSQTCHAYCTFCFRWPQFTASNDLKFASKEINTLIEYIKSNPSITDLLITGGDPMVMKPKLFNHFIDEILKANPANLRNIRIGSKSLAFWPYKFTADEDSGLLLRSFEKIVNSGRHLSFMAHFNHFAELSTDVVRLTINRILQTGAVIRTQSPLFQFINDDPEVWSTMWNQQVRLGCIPYYMFIARHTGAQHYFKVDLERAWNIFRKAYQDCSGLARTVRGPVMSCSPGKVQVLGVTEINNEKVFALRFLQGRNEDWVHRPFFAQYDADAFWINNLRPAFGEDKFFFEDELSSIYEEKSAILSNV